MDPSRSLISGFQKHARALRSRVPLKSAGVTHGSRRSPTAVVDTATAKDHKWGEYEFGSLQSKAAARLHRFYVPQPLGPAAPPPSLDTLLSVHAGPDGSPAPPAASPAAPNPKPAAGPVPPSASPPPAPASVVLEGEEARHAARALRLQPGDRVELCDGRGHLLEGLVTGTDRQRVWVAPDGPCVHVPWRGSRWVVAVACTTLKGSRAEWLVEKLTELGAFMMVPLVTERSQAGGKSKFRTRGSAASRSGPSDVDSDSDVDYQPGRLERVAIAATKQSLRPHALHLTPPTPLADLLPLLRRAAGGGSAGSGKGSEREVGGNGTGPEGTQPGAAACRAGDGEGKVPGGSAGSGCCSFGLVAVAGAPPLVEVLRDVRDSWRVGPAVPAAGPGECGEASGGSAACEAGDADAKAPLRLLFIGPEGDFTPGELVALVGAGARPVGLGANRLRTETAAVGLLAACLLTEEGG